MKGQDKRLKHILHELLRERFKTQGLAYIWLEKFIGKNHVSSMTKKELMITVSKLSDYSTPTKDFLTL